MAFILGSAVLIDWALGDPPNSFHPVAWMGSLISLVKRGGLGRGKRCQVAYGLLLVLLGSVFVFIVFKLFLSYVRGFSLLPYLLVGALLLKSSFTFSGLRKAAQQVGSCLQAGNLEEARRLASTHLVSRDTRSLDAGAVASATVESVAENLTDGLVAPIFYYALGGVPAALAYRFVNTADSMLGYRDQVHEYLGKGAARLDDVLNYVPARLAGLLLVASAWLRGESAGGAWKIMWAEHSRTASPNAGWTMSAAAGALGVTLEKQGHYRLGDARDLPSTEHISRAIGLVRTAYILSMIIILVIMFGVWHGR